MKYRTTKKATLNNYTCIKVGYCNLQHLLNYENPEAYTSGVNGWGADVYSFGGVAIVTGYAPFGVAADYDTCRKYDEAAAAILYSRRYDYEVENDLLKTLIHEFIDEVLAA